MVNKNGHKRQADATAGVGFASRQSLASTEAASEADALRRDASGDVQSQEVLVQEKEPEKAQKTEQENLNKIRDILFGQQVQTHEQRFEQLEQKLEAECDRLRSQFNQQLDRQISTLEDRVISHADRLTEQIRSESSDRKAANESLSRTLQDTAAELSRQAEGLDEKLVETRQEMLAELKHEVTTLRSQFDTQVEDLLASLEQDSASHKASLVQERQKLSGLLVQMAQQLDGGEN